MSSRLWFGDTQTSFAIYQKQKEKRNLWFALLTVSKFSQLSEQRKVVSYNSLTLRSKHIANLTEIEGFLKQLLP